MRRPSERPLLSWEDVQARLHPLAAREHSRKAQYGTFCYLLSAKLSSAENRAFLGWAEAGPGTFKFQCQFSVDIKIGGPHLAPTSGLEDLMKEESRYPCASSGAVV